MKTTLFLMLAFAAFVGASAPSANAQKNLDGRRGHLATADYRFASTAAESEMMEVKLGELARVQGADILVRLFGERMVVDHGIAGNNLRVLSAKKAAVLPTLLTVDAQGRLDQLRLLTGANFDKAYAKMMVEDHKRLLNDYRKAALTANDSDLKSFAAKLAEVVSVHLDQARQMEAKVRGAH